MRWDPSRVATVAGNRDLYGLNNSGDSILRVTGSGATNDHTHSDIAPDWNQVAVVRGTTTDAALWVLNLARKQEQQIKPSWATVGLGGVVFSGDGWIYFAARETLATDDFLNIYRSRPDGTSFTQITDTTDHESDVSISPDGTQICYIRTVTISGLPKPRVYIANVDGTGQTEVHDGGPNLGSQGGLAIGDYDPEFSPDGTEIVFGFTNVNIPTGNFGFGSHELVITQADGSSASALTSLNSFSLVPAWRSDNTILFTEWNSAAGYTGLSTIQSDGTGHTQLESGVTKLFDGGIYGRWIPSFDPTWPHL